MEVQDGGRSTRHLEAAVRECESYISIHRRYARGTLLALLGVIYLGIFVAMFTFVVPIFEKRNVAVPTFDYSTASSLAAAEVKAAQTKARALPAASSSVDSSALSEAAAARELAEKTLLENMKLRANGLTSGVPRAGESSVSSAVITGSIALLSVVIAILLSLYRFHLKEISRTEHYKLGFLRIRVAAMNTAEGFQGEVRASLTEGAFLFESPSSKKQKVESPVPGHPGYDAAALLLDKLLDATASAASKVSTARTD